MRGISEKMLIQQLRESVSGLMLTLEMFDGGLRSAPPDSQNLIGFGARRSPART